MLSESRGVIPKKSMEFTQMEEMLRQNGYHCAELADNRDPLGRCIYVRSKDARSPNWKLRSLKETTEFLLGIKA